MLPFPDYKRAVERYSRIVALTGVLAFGLFDVVMWINLLQLESFFPAMRVPIDARWSWVLQVIWPLSFMALSSLPSLLLLILVIRRARQQPFLHCPFCRCELASDDSRRHVLGSLHCPNCHQQVLGQTESQTTIDASATLPQKQLGTKDYEQLRFELRGHLRFAVIAWGIALPLIYGILIWSKLTGPFPNSDWLFVVLGPVAIVAMFLGLMWGATIATAVQARKIYEDRAKLK